MLLLIKISPCFCFWFYSPKQEQGRFSSPVSFFSFFLVLGWIWLFLSLSLGCRFYSVYCPRFLPFPTISLCKFLILVVHLYHLPHFPFRFLRLFMFFRFQLPFALPCLLLVCLFFISISLLFGHCRSWLWPMRMLVSTFLLSGFSLFFCFTNHFMSISEEPLLFLPLFFNVFHHLFHLCVLYRWSRNPFWLFLICIPFLDDVDFLAGFDFQIWCSSEFLFDLFFILSD